MPVPRIEDEPCVINNVTKAFKIVWLIRHMGYYVDNTRAAVDLIEKANLDKSRFDFPYGSFEEFKKHATTGEFDIDESVMHMLDEERKQIKRDVEEGRLWVMH